jgi:uncharacterized membrane protein (DUF4010 family)
MWPVFSRPLAYRAILIATGAMALRNGVIVALLAPRALVHCVAPLGLMLLVSFMLLFRCPEPEEGPVRPLTLESPFKLSAALVFGLVFLGLNVAGALAQRTFGAASFYSVSAVGGLLSSASSIASAATLIRRGEVPVVTGVNGVVLSSITSILINVPLVHRLCENRPTRRRTTRALLLVAVAGLVGAVANYGASGPLLDFIMGQQGRG